MDLGLELKQELHLEVAGHEKRSFFLYEDAKKNVQDTDSL